MCCILIGYCVLFLSVKATLLKKCNDGFWIVAVVGLSVLVRELVTPYQAAACFERFRNQKYAMTEYVWVRFAETPWRDETASLVRSGV